MWKTSGGPSSYFEIYKRSLSPRPYGGLFIEFQKISIAMKKNIKQPEYFRVADAPECATEEDINKKLMQEMVKFLDCRHKIVMMTGWPGARGSIACLKQLITPKINRLVPVVELLYCLLAAKIITVRLVRGIEAALVMKSR